MRLTKLFSMTFVFFLLLWGFGGGKAKQSEIDSINTQIQELERMKMGYESRALKHENYAEYLQFNDKAVLETRRHLQIADENRQKADFLQKQINELTMKRDKLQK